MNDLCPICEEGFLEARVGTNEFEYKGQVKIIPMHYSECTCCGSEQTSSADLRKNKRLMIEFKEVIWTQKCLGDSLEDYKALLNTMTPLERESFLHGSWRASEEDYNG